MAEPVTRHRREEEKAGVGRALRLPPWATREDLDCGDGMDFPKSTTGLAAVIWMVWVEPRPAGFIGQGSER